MFFPVWSKAVAAAELNKSFLGLLYVQHLTQLLAWEGFILCYFIEKFLLYCLQDILTYVSQFIIILRAQLMINAAFVCDEFRMLLNSLWMIWIILYFLQNYAIVSKYLALRYLEAGLKISDETCREGNMLMSTNMMGSLCQTRLWNTDGIWLYIVANNLVS